METLLIDEQFVSHFKYWREGQIRTGMRFRNHLFECASKFNQHQRYQAFDLALRLTQAAKESIVTVSSSQCMVSHYTVWINLRAMSDPAIANQLDALNRDPLNCSADDFVLLKTVLPA